MFHTIFWITLASTCLAQSVRSPDVEAQRAAMKKLDFLIGNWSGEGRMLRGAAEPLEFLQTEEVQYKLDGLVLMIEGIGLTKADGKPVVRALATVSFDDQTGIYHMRAYNDGRYLETELKLADAGKGMRWGFTLGEVRTHSVMRINEKGEWAETHEITIGSQPPREFMEITVRPRK
jgi:hypothetical protein